MDASEILPYVGSIVSVLLSIASLTIAHYRASTSETKELEHRLTQLEANQFTKEDRQCLRENDLKMKLFWGIVEKDFPKLLKQHQTPLIDKLLTKAETGIKNLTPKDTSKLIKALDGELTLAVSHENVSRALAIAFYSVVLKYEKGIISPPRACV